VYDNAVGATGRSHADARRTTRRRRLGAALALTTSAMLLAACGGDDGGPPTLTWYIVPDPGGQAVADRCTQEAGGAYTIEASLLPNNGDGQREQLLRRLAANDAGVDLMSLDIPFTPEFAEAGFLYEIPEDRREQLTQDIFEASLETATWKDELVAVPFHANTQLLWYRKSVAEQAGLDVEAGVTWDQLVQAAEQTGTTVSVQANRYEGYVVWINALIESAGGAIIENPEADVEDLEFSGLTGDAGRVAAETVRQVAQVGAAGMTTAMEEESRSAFQADNGGFLVNWPYVWDAVSSAVEEGSLPQTLQDDIGWATYPSIEQGGEPAAPLGGLNVAVGAFTNHPDEALDALECITSPESQKLYMLEVGNPAAVSTVYDDPEVRERFPMADTIRESLEQAAPRPQTPFYGEVSASIQREWHPAGGVDPQRTPEASAKLIKGVLAKEVLL
jgi:multiple sugar transport system substrate-binding protein